MIFSQTVEWISFILVFSNSAKGKNSSSTFNHARRLVAMATSLSRLVSIFSLLLLLPPVATNRKAKNDKTRESTLFQESLAMIHKQKKIARLCWLIPMSAGPKKSSIPRVGWLLTGVVDVVAVVQANRGHEFH